MLQQVYICGLYVWLQDWDLTERNWETKTFVEEWSVSGLVNIPGNNAVFFASVLNHKKSSSQAP